MRKVLLVWWWAAGAAVAAVDHGPLVVWNGQASREARVVWIENGKAESGREGAWFRAAAGFGYGDNDDATVFAGMRGRYDSLAIRCKVRLGNKLPADAVLVLEVDYDDGFIAWFDGKEVARRNVVEKDGRLTAAKKREGGRPEMIRLGTVKELVKGPEAVVALRGFNDETGSSDFSLHPRLVAVVGTKRVELVAKGADWEYLAGKEPGEGWQTQSSAAAEEDRPLASSGAVVCFPVEAPGESREVDCEARRFGDTRNVVHVARLGGLRPDTEYGLLLPGAGGERPREAAAARTWPWRFRTAPEEFKPFAFVTGGDMYHRRELLDGMNRRAGLEDPMFALLGGDLAYCNGVDSKRWLDWVDSWVANARTRDGRLLPMVTAIGNHEVRGIGYSPVHPPGIREAPFYRSLFLDGEQGATHCVDFGRYLSLILLDSGHAAPVKPQADFLAKALAERAAVPRVFACYHRPAYGAGAKEDAKEIVEAWCPLFEQHRIDAVFENDHHVFKRSFPILSGQVNEKDGIPYIGDGAWGVDVRKVDQAEVKRRPWIAKAGAVNHLHRLDLDAKGYRVTTKKADGTVIDEFSRAWRRGN